MEKRYPAERNADQTTPPRAQSRTKVGKDTETVSLDLNLDGTPELARVLDRSRDHLGRDTGFQLKDGTTIENQAAYGYNPTDGRLQTVADASSGSFQYSYVPNSHLIESVAGPVHTVINTWEPTRDVLASKQNKVGTTVISQYDYTVNAIAQRTGVTTSGTAFPATPAWAWGYDPIGQLTSADHSTNNAFDRAYQFDTIGNRKKSGDSLTLPGNDNYLTNALNQYTAVGAITPTYDDDGNATDYPVPAHPGANSILAWDAENRLISATVNGVPVHHLYDAQFRKIATTTGGATTLHLYDGWNCIAEYSTLDFETFDLGRTYTWGTDLSGTLQGAGGVGGLLLITDHSALITHHFPTYDGNGNVSEYLTLTNNGVAVAAHFEYDPFGNLIVDSEANAASFPYRFSTKPQDATTGLYYYGYRYYDPITGRWLSKDPIGENGGMNVHAFVENSPLRGVDSLGLLVVTPDLQRPEDVPVTWSDEGLEPDWLGATSKSGIVDCSCECPDQTTRTKYWFARCSVATRYKITLKLSAYESRTWNFWRGVWGHEMAHARSRNLIIQTNVIDWLAKEKDKFTKENDCLNAIGKPRRTTNKNGEDTTPKADGYIQKYQLRLDESMKGNNHKGKGMSNHLSPEHGKPVYPPDGIDPPRPPAKP